MSIKQFSSNARCIYKGVSCGFIVLSGLCPFNTVYTKKAKKQNKKRGLTYLWQGEIALAFSANLQNTINEKTFT
jgi:hypothetical protein